MIPIFSLSLADSARRLAARRRVGIASPAAAMALAPRNARRVRAGVAGERGGTDLLRMGGVKDAPPECEIQSDRCTGDEGWTRNCVPPFAGRANHFASLTAKSSTSK